MINDDELRQVMPNLPVAKRALYLPFLQQAMSEFGISTFLREAAFLGQLAHESAELRFMEEIASGAAYEGRKDLGNTQPGDGRRFKGRGPIQLTGRANYKKFGDLLGLDLITQPEQVAKPEVGFRTSALFWKSNGLNELADQQDYRRITRRINGGFNGWDDRVKYYERAKGVLNQESRALPGEVDLEGRRDIPPNLSRGILPGLEAKKKAKPASKAGKKAAAKKRVVKSVATAGAKKSRPAATKKRGGKASAKRAVATKGKTKKAAAKKSAKRPAKHR